jgi:serine/threonine protein phosphatase 1
LAWTKSKSSKSQRPSIPRGRRIYAIGDIHGRADLLSNLFDRIDADLRQRPVPHATELCLGDYVDRGPASRQVIDSLITRRRTNNMIFLKGNHEDCLLRILTDPSELDQWKTLGGLTTLLSYGVKPTRGVDYQANQKFAAQLAEAMPASHRQFLENLAIAFTCGDFFFAHAGVRPGIPLGTQNQEDLLWIRDEFLLHEENFGKVVVHGHTPAREPEIRPNRINIDTGAYATGQLTCLVLEGEEMRFL